MKTLHSLILLAGWLLTGCVTFAKDHTSADEDQLDLINSIDIKTLPDKGDMFDIEIIQQMQDAIAAGNIKDGKIQTETFGDIQLSKIMPVRNDDVMFIDVYEMDGDNPFTQCMVLQPSAASIYPFGICADGSKGFPSFVVPRFTTCLDEKIKYLAACACGTQSPFDPPDDALLATCGQDEAYALQSRCLRLSRIGMFDFDSPRCQGQ